MIEIMEKPEWVSWDDIHDIVYKAHESNREKGVDIKNAHLSGEELKKSLGSDGVCFVALDGEKVVATSSVAFHTLNTWYAPNKKVGYGTLSAVLPEYKGLHIFSKLEKMRVDYAKKIGCYGLYKKISEKNIRMRNISKKTGYYEVAINRTSYNPHNYVTIFKWFGNKPYSAKYIQLRYFYLWIKLKVNLILGRIK